MTAIPPPTDLDRMKGSRLAAIESAGEPILALPADYPAGYQVLSHRHGRGQLLYPRSGVVMVTTVMGRWMVPPEHALWIPAGIDHSVDMLGAVRMLSVYVARDAIGGLPDSVRVVGLTDLMRALIVRAVETATEGKRTSRAGLVEALLLDEISNLPECPLGLPFPADPRLAELCRRFVAAPSPHLTIDEWADTLAMSRRAFTRAFRRQTGLSLSTWRQQACVFTAVPRLTGGESITSVALDLGYDSVAAFTTMFKRMLGAAPRDYLRIAASSESRDRKRSDQGFFVARADAASARPLRAGSSDGAKVSAASKSARARSKSFFAA